MPWPSRSATVWFLARLSLFFCCLLRPGGYFVDKGRAVPAWCRHRLPGTCCAGLLIVGIWALGGMYLSNPSPGSSSGAVLGFHYVDDLRFLSLVMGDSVC